LDQLRRLVQRSERYAHPPGASNVRPARGGLADPVGCAARLWPLVVNREAAVAIVVAIAKDLTKEHRGGLAVQNERSTARLDVRRGISRQ
jgi:hypothetical protein